MKSSDLEISTNECKCLLYYLTLNVLVSSIVYRVCSGLDFDYTHQYIPPTSRKNSNRPEQTDRWSVDFFLILLCGVVLFSGRISFSTFTFSVLVFNT